MGAVLAVIFCLVFGGSAAYAQDETWEKGMVLSSDTTVKGNLYVKGGTVDLNGYTLTVTGNYNQIGGTLKIGTGTLNVSGDLDLCVLNGNTYGKTSSSIYFSMTDAKGRVNVGGSYRQNANLYDSRSAGIMTVAGDFCQYGSNSFYSSNSFELVLTGEKAHNFVFENSSSCIQTLTVKDGGSLKCSNSYFKANTVTTDLLINSDGGLVLEGLGLQGNKCTINSPEAVIAEGGTIDIGLGQSGAELNVNSAFEIHGGTLKIGAGTLNVKEDLNLCVVNGTNYGKTSSSVYFSMTDAKGRLNVGGSYRQNANLYDSRTAGIMTVNGDFCQYGTNSFYSSSAFELVLVGNRAHEIKLEEKSSKIGNLTINNGADTKLLSDVIVDKDVNLYDAVLNLNGYTLTVGGNFNQFGGTVKENGGTLTVKGKHNVNGAVKQPEVTAVPTAKPTEAPVATPTEAPVSTPTAKPTEAPAATPTEAPVSTPAGEDDEYDDDEDLIDIADCSVTVKNVKYTGSARKATVTVKYDGEKLKKNRDYILTYSNNTKIGKATVKVTGKGKYEGSIKKTFKILPQTPEILDIYENEDGRGYVIEWEESEDVSGYEIKYAKKKSGTYSKLKTVADNDTECTTTKLSDGMYVKIRAYKKVNGTKFYSDYSEIFKFEE